jgi:transcriptional accessory protein Tex/SPT6
MIPHSRGGATQFVYRTRIVKLPAHRAGLAGASPVKKGKATVLAVDGEKKRVSLSMKKSPGEKPAADQHNTADASKAGERKIQEGKPKRRDDKKPGREKAAPEPFNNPFADAFRRSKRGYE